MESSEKSPSMWESKPWWCQPWSIVLTGVAIPSGSWLWLHLWWVTTPIALVITGWWYLFLYLVPKQYAEMESEA